MCARAPRWTCPRPTRIAQGAPQAPVPGAARVRAGRGGRSGCREEPLGAAGKSPGRGLGRGAPLRAPPAGGIQRRGAVLPAAPSGFWVGASG